VEGNRGGRKADSGGSDEVEQSFSSTTWEWRKTKIRRPPDGQQTTRPKGGHWHGLPPRPIRETITLTVTWRGGPECWYEIKARGRTGRVPGWLSFHDVMMRINNEESYGPR
jgi:hypothetical protein